MFSPIRLLKSVAAGGLVTLLASTVLAVPPQYHAIDLGAITPGGSSDAHGLNNHNQVVGYASTATGEHAFVWNSGTLTDLGTLGGDTSLARSINDHGVIVGESRNASGFQRAFSHNGSFTDLGTLGGNESRAYDINELGQITGYSNFPVSGFGAPVRPFLYQSGSMTQLGTISGIAAQAQVRAINEHAQIVGHSQGPPLFPGEHAFSYTGGPLQDLTPGASFAVANDVNDAGVIVGVNDGKAFKIQGGVTTSLHDSTYVSSEANAINNAGNIVGLLNGGMGVPIERAALWESGTLYDLNTLLDPASAAAWHLFWARDINDHGYIVGSGIVHGERHGFLLVPVPEPASLTVLASAAALARRTRRV